MIKAFFDVGIHDPRKIEESAQVFGDDIIQNMLLVILSPKKAIDKLQTYVDPGFTEIVMTNSSSNREDLCIYL